MQSYVQVIAQHRDRPERFLIRSADDRWFVWFGDGAGTPLQEIDEPIADWLRRQTGLTMLPEPHFWFALADLPLAATSPLWEEAPPLEGDEA
ncbi:MAG: hypothetical protein ACJ789_14320 [Thermomicrobiales bacterium]